jgi:hypothetical protein
VSISVPVLRGGAVIEVECHCIVPRRAKTFQEGRQL